MVVLRARQNMFTTSKKASFYQSLSRPSCTTETLEWNLGIMSNTVIGDNWSNDRSLVRRLRMAENADIFSAGILILLFSYSKPDTDKEFRVHMPFRVSLKLFACAEDFSWLLNNQEMSLQSLGILAKFLFRIKSCNRSIFIFTLPFFNLFYWQNVLLKKLRKPFNLINPFK